MPGIAVAPVHERNNEMRSIILVLLVCLLMTSCNIRVIKQETFTPVAAADVQATDNARVATAVAATVAALRLPASTVTPIATGTVTPTLAPAPTTPASPSQPVRALVPFPALLSFTSSAYDPSDSVTLYWSSTGAVQATLRRTTASGVGDFERDVPPSGSLVVDSKGAGRHWHNYELVVYNSVGASDRRLLTVRFPCSYSFFFRVDVASYLYDPRLCPDGPPQSTQAAEQIFEGGRMIWLEHAAPIRQWDWGTGGQDDFIILALYSPGVAWPQKQTFVDAWSPNELDSDPDIVPPSGKFQPIRGFGKVWRTHSDVRQKLGWALNQETSFDAVYQLVSDFYGHSACLYLSVADGHVVSLCNHDGSWGFVML